MTIITGFRDYVRRLKTSQWLVIFLFAFLLIVLQRLPLFRDLDYEYHALTAVFLFWICAGLALISDTHHSPQHRLSDNTLSMIILIVIALLIFHLGVIIHHCCYLRGITWFVLLPLTTAFAGYATCQMMTVLFKYHRWMIYLMLMGGTFIYNLVLVFYFPMVSVYSFFWGYFAGPVYDEGVPIDQVILTHRFLVVLAAGIVLWLAKKIQQSNLQSQRNKQVALLFLLITVFAVLFHNGKMGFLRSEENLQELLPLRFSTEHTDWYADSTISRDELHDLARMGEYHYRDLFRLLQLNRHKTVRIYLFRDARQKKQMTGAGQTQIARIWNDALFLHGAQAELSLRHEMIHILAQEFGHPLLGSFYTGLLEGLAVAFDWEDEELTADQWARVIQQRESMPDMKKIMREKLFFSGATALSYTLAGSFCHYLIDRYSMDSFRQVYARGHYEKVYGKSPELLLDEWYHNIQTVKISAADTALASAILRPSFMERSCRHAVTEKMYEARQLANREQWEKALTALEEALKMDSSRTYLYQQYAVYLQRAGRSRDALYAVEKGLRIGNPHPRMLAHLLLLKADMTTDFGDSLAALNLYRQIAHQFVYYNDVVLESQIKIHLLHHYGTIRNFLLKEENSRNETKDSLLNLWIGKLYYERRQWSEALDRLQKTSSNETLYEYFRYRWMAECYSKTGQWAKAAQYFRMAADRCSNEASYRYLRKKSEYCEWILNETKKNIESP